jgi:amidase
MTGITALTQASATALAAAIRDRKTSAAEVVEACMRRIESVNPRLNAVVQLTAEAARREARAADQALARGGGGPLHGVPFTVKDWIEAEGVVCAAGVEERAGFVPKQDATVVARLRAAGAILLGKTNVRENPVYGRTCNPYDLSRTPGISSSGEAAIIAAAGSPLGLGSDSGGSIRVPAAYCGVAGLKPTHGRVPVTGHFPRIGSLSDPRTTIGPIARWVEDLAQVLPIIAGVDWRDDGVIPMPLASPAEVDLGKLRLAFYTGFEGAAPATETVAAVKQAAGVLDAVCLEVVEALPPRIEESLPITRAYWNRVRSWAWSDWRAEAETKLSGEEVERSVFAWERLRRSFISFMQRFDAIVCPATEGAAGHEAGEADFLYTLPYSLTGWPCVVVRGGSSAEGLPIGVQVVARPWREDVALALAACLERELGGWQPPPL